MSAVPGEPAWEMSLTEPTWEIAHPFPAQGTWTVEEYLSLNTNRLVEFSHGYLAVLAMPTTSHQMSVGFLMSSLLAWVKPAKSGRVLLAPLPVQLRPGKFREPDVPFMRAEHAARMREEFWEGAGLVMEVVSPDDRRRDLEIKRREYARAGIPEYWIVDPQQAQITVLRLEGQRYVVHGEFRKGTRATPALLPGFGVEVDAVFALNQ